ncbi:MAG: N-6 DNA methylase [Betaproteobacteria bacterium]|nr:N-6 DNA methylase [Betaproteobacteria bacterium]
MNFIENETAQKLRGGYYTPLDLAVFLAQWIKDIRPARILEPSCGDGVFFEALANVKGLQEANVLGFELEPDEAAKAQARAKAVGIEAVIHNEDFLQWTINHRNDVSARFDAIVGNPPFIRYQYLPAPFQVCAEQIFRELSLPFTKHTNAWVSFILASMTLLRPGGRLAMVVPAEIIHVTHAQSLRSYLGRECRRLVIIDPEELWFSDTLQGAVILLAEKKHGKTDRAEGLGIYPVKGREFLYLNPADVFLAPQSINGKTVQGKWTRALLDQETLALFDELAQHEAVHQFKDIAEVYVGIVTGANKFFLVPDEVVENYKLDKWAHPMFGRSEHCPGIIYDDQQHAANAAKGNPTNFLWFLENKGKVDTAAETYIRQGEEQDLHTRYKCRIRTPWYTVPSVYATEIGMLKRAHDTPRLILNRIGAYTTDTAYRIRTRGVTPEKLVGCFINPLTALSAELEGRHYGGGVLELIPSEIERLMIPLPEEANVDLVGLDNAIRNLPTYEVLAYQGKTVLGAMGISHAKQERVLDGWRKLKGRRHRTSEESSTDAS